nr:DEAD/DEAH box helicase [Kofleriaceae bacterium]
MTDDALAPFSEAARGWFRDALGAPTPVQARGWAAVAAGRHTLMLAPTGSGKTLAAFLWCLDRLAVELARDPAATGTRVIYLSPIKALAYDVERNLRAPLAGMQARGAGAAITVDVRTGDTPAKERERQRKHPGHILITTPESLYLLLASRARERLRDVQTVIVDEIHALAPTKRGAHLALSLERLAALTGRDPQRIGLSATQRPLSEVARYLGGDRAVEVVDAGALPALDLEIVVPAAMPDLRGRPSDETARPAESAWPAIYARLVDLVLAHRSTIIFVNSRRLAERVAQAVTDAARARGVTGELVRAHHGSVARLARVDIEEALKAGRLRAITATSSLELGIDMGAVDLVVQLESPGAVSRGLQRIGRASHHVGGTSSGKIIPKFRGDLLEATVVARRMKLGAVEAIRVPDGQLDVLAQQIVAMVAVEPWPVDDLERVIRRAASYRELARPLFTGVLDMLSGRYPSDDMAELRPRITWDRQAGVLTARRGARLLSITSGGTIPDRGMYAVHVGADGPRIGELDEEMVAESRRGETFILGASTWRIEDITRDRVVVTPAPGEPGKMPFWRGDGPGRPVELGYALGAFCRELDGRIADDPAAARAWLMADARLDARAADELCGYLEAQRAHTGGLPTDAAIAIERFRDELGDQRVCILTPFGGRVHAPWALVIARRLERQLGYPVHPLWTDDGIALRFADADRVPDDDALIPGPDEVEAELIAELAHASVFASQFRQNAARALLLPRRRPGQRTPLWAQRLRAQQLMGVASTFPEFPITLETYRECLTEVFDLPALRDVLAKLRGGDVRVVSATTDGASPFARSLVFDYVAAFLYEGDAPLAERKAQALTLDRGLLRELVGGGELRELLDVEVLAAVDAELQARAAGRRARDGDELCDVLRRVGELDDAELAARCEVDVAPIAGALAASVRIARVAIGGAARWIAVEDVARYRDALGVAVPAGVPAELLAARDGDAFVDLVARYARTHAPFQPADVAARWGVTAAQVEAALGVLEARGAVVRGPMRPIAPGVTGSGDDVCDAEVLRQIRRRTLAALRAKVAPVPAATYAAFLPRWHGLEAPRRGPAALRDAIGKLEGVPLPLSELEARILPARVADYHPRMLDELGATGEVAWIGAGSLGARDGRVVLVRRDRAALLAPAVPAAIPGATAAHDAILALLRGSGASFFVAIEDVAGRGEVARDALWDLVWAGLVTNDTFAPLRSLAAAPASKRRSPYAAFGGRWSLVERGDDGVSATARAHAHATALLARHGVASRGAARADDVPGGFATVSDVLRAMEDAGAVRRGAFVAGLEDPQFAVPATIDRLREPPRGAAPRVHVMSAVDPALAYGAALAWPPMRAGDARPARRVGASCVLVAGQLALVVEPKGRRIATGALASDAEIALAMRVGLPALAALARRRELLVEAIDGVPATSSPFAGALTAAGARVDYRGLVVHGSPLAPAPADDPDDDEDGGGGSGDDR